MDKRFENAIIKMESLSGKAKELQENVTAQFAKVQKDQDIIDTKLIKVNKEIEKALDSFQKETEMKIKYHNDSIEKLKSDSDKSFESISEVTQKVQDDYSERINKLIKSINNKSKEILKIYDELDNIKRIQKDAIKTFGKLADEHKELMEGFNEKTKKIVKESDMGNLIEIISKFDTRVQKLEKHAHKHTFGGTKI